MPVRGYGRRKAGFRLPSNRALGLGVNGGMLTLGLGEAELTTGRGRTRAGLGLKRGLSRVESMSGILTTRSETDKN